MSRADAHPPDTPAEQKSPHQAGAPATDARDYQEQRRQSSATLKEFLAPIRSRIGLARAFTIASCVVGLGPYVALTRLGEILLSSEGVDNARLTHTTTLLLYAFLAQVILYFIALAITHFADLRLRNILQQRIIERIARVPLAWLSDSSTGRVRRAVQDETLQVHTVVAHAPVEYTAAVASPVVLLVYAFVVDWRLGLLSLATYPLYGLLQLLLMRDMGAKTAEMDDHLTEISSRAIELTDGIAVVKNFGHTGQAHSRFTKACDDFADFYWAWCGPLVRSSAFSMSVISMGTLMAINIGGGLAMAQAGWVSVPEVLVCSLIALIVPTAIEVLGSAAWTYQQAGNAALKLREVLDMPQLESIEATETGATSESARAAVDPGDTTVHFRSVSYSYSSGGERIPALQDVTLALEPGTVTALVGPSGSGKSTLATMLARFRDPDEGAIAIGGRDLRAMSERELYSRVSFVLQEPYLQNTTIREIIRLARPEASDAEVRAAAEAANIWADIASLPDGLDTVLGDATDFSGGQRQRLGIARAVLADAPILVLDEATAATDPDCEAEIQQALARLSRGRTVLVIGHHAETVIGADRICVMERGRIVASGTAEELKDQPYWRTLQERTRR